MDMNRWSLRQLPLPAKLVVSCFLTSVGIGYGSAMVQLHFQHGSPGNRMPTPDDVVEHFAGIPHFLSGPPEGEGPQPPPKPVSKIERLVTADITLPFNGNGQMKAAFFHKSGTGFERLVKELGEEEAKAERQAELDAFLVWVRSDPAAQKKTFDADSLPVPEDILGAINPEMLTKEEDAVAIRFLVEQRCATCHKPGDTDPAFTDEFTSIEPYLEVKPVDEKLGVTKSTKQVGVEALTQSTHAHLLSFSMLFALTGLTFAFSTYPGWLRGLLGPLVLVAQVADISCWWLARLDGVGPYFALSIMGTGAVVGLGLFLQITLSLFNMYGKGGKAVLVALFLAGGGGLYVLETKVIRPQLESERGASIDSGATQAGVPAPIPAVGEAGDGGE